MSKDQLTEREIIRILVRRFGTGWRLPLDFEDDVACYPLGRKGLVVLKSDMLVGSTDVPPGMTLRQAARKAVVSTVSDFAAKGIQPRALLASLGLTSPVGPTVVNKIAQGLFEGAREYGCSIIGGDTSQADDLIIDCIGFGFAAEKRIMRRDGAKPGDLVAVTGDFGKTTAGLQIIMARDRRLARRYPALVRSVLLPIARLHTGLRLVRTGSVTSSIDSSDGLAWSLHEISRLSKVNIVVEKIPVAREVEHYVAEKGLAGEELALYGGEEYELVLTLKRERFTQARRMIPSLRKIGRVENGRGEIRSVTDGEEARIEPRGYEHFLRT